MSKILSKILILSLLICSCTNKKKDSIISTSTSNISNNILSSSIDSSISSSIKSTSDYLLSSSDSINSSIIVSSDEKPVILGVPRDKAMTAYQLLVYAFYDSDGDQYGDLNGVTMKLDYLKELGVDLLWLSPINPSRSYHGYDVNDYYGIDPKIGTMSDFDNLVKAAHEKEIRIILDMVINHTSNEHPWFLQYCAGNNEKKDWYKTKNSSTLYGSGGLGNWYTCPGNDSKQYFGAFSRVMPDLDYTKEEVKNAYKDVLSFWLDKGVDGFRYDAIKHIFDPNEMPNGTNTSSLNKSFWTEMNDFVRSYNPLAYLVGENITDINGLKTLANAFDAEFDFPGYWDATKGVKNEYLGDGSWSYGTALEYNQKVLHNENANWLDCPITGNHDFDRISSIIGTFDSNWQKKLKLYAAATLLRPGMPFIFAGDEYGLLGSKNNNSDKELRLPMRWTSDYNIDPQKYLGNINYSFNNKVTPINQQLENQDSVLSFYKDLITFRESIPAIWGGTIYGKLTGSDTGGFRLAKDGKSVYVIINFRNAECTAFKIDYGYATKILFGSGTILSSELNNNRVQVPPLGFVVVDLD